MLNFENTFLDGLSLSGNLRAKASLKGKGKPTKPAVRNRSLGLTGATGAVLGGRLHARATPLGSIALAVKKAQARAKASASFKLPKNAEVAKAATTIAKLKAQAIAFPKKGLPHFAATALTPTASLMAKAPAVAVALRAAQSLGAPTITPAALMAAKGVVAARTGLAAGLMSKAVTALAKKAPILPANIPLHIITAKAAQAVAPVAHACKCQAKHVVKKLDNNLTCKGYPANTASSLLASVHDMNTALEKAALQRLATYEHNKLTSKARFEHEVLEKLASLAGKLAPCHPARTRAHLTILRKTGG